MPLNIDYVYTDRARVVRRIEGARIEHETQIVESYSEWFKCRIAVAYQFGQERNTSYRRSIESTHQFICKLTDFLGQPVQIAASDRLQVETGPGTYVSNSQDAGTYEIVELPFKPRDLKEELLWVINLKRLDEH